MNFLKSFLNGWTATGLSESQIIERPEIDHDISDEYPLDVIGRCFNGKLTMSGTSINNDHLVFSAMKRMMPCFGDVRDMLTFLKIAHTDLDDLDQSEVTNELRNHGFRLDFDTIRSNWGKIQKLYREHCREFHPTIIMACEILSEDIGKFKAIPNFLFTCLQGDTHWKLVNKEIVLIYGNEPLNFESGGFPLSIVNGELVLTNSNDITAMGYTIGAVYVNNLKSTRVKMVGGNINIFIDRANC